LLGSDIAPIAPNIRKADCRNLPRKTASIDVVALIAAGTSFRYKHFSSPSCHPRHAPRGVRPQV
jgi:hypothetical protein